jgi:hypothetical protein
MQTIKMSYKGLIFDVNPTSVKTEFSKSIAKKKILFKSSKSQEMCFNPVKISGSGKLIGDKAKEQAHNLMRIFKSKGSAYLFVPELPPIKAYLSELNISFNSAQNCIDYDFAFIEDSEDKDYLKDFAYTYAFEGENLYDISNRTEISVENLFEYNDYSDLFSVNEGDKVWLC